MSNTNKIATKNEEERQRTPFSPLNLPAEDDAKQELQVDNHHHRHHQRQLKRTRQQHQDADEVHQFSQSQSTKYVKDARKDKYYIEKNKAAEYSKQLNSGPRIDSQNTIPTEVHLRENESSGFAHQANVATSAFDGNGFFSSGAPQAPQASSANNPAPDPKAESPAPAPKKARKRGRHQRRAREGSHAATERADHDSHDEPTQQN